nr:unnamed protein product [Digitaria exilis]
MAPPALRKLGEDARPLQRKGSVKHELFSLGSAPPALDGDGEGGEPSQRRGRMRRGVGAEKTVCVAGHDRRRPGRPKGSVGRRWVELDIQRADPNMFVGLACKVFWPLDDDWYKGTITLYNEATKKHSIKYDDGETEVLTLADERIKFSISSQEMKSLNLNIGFSNLDKKGHDELLALAVSFHDYQGLDPGDLVWAKITDPNSVTSYKMEVIRNSDTKVRPLFRVTSEDGVLELPNARSCLKYFENSGDFVLGYRAVHVNWKDLDFCNVCDMDEEYEDNLFLQCDKCRMMDFGFAICVDLVHLAFLQNAAYVQSQMVVGLILHVLYGYQKHA